MLDLTSGTVECLGSILCERHLLRLKIVQCQLIMGFGLARSILIRALKLSQGTLEIIEAFLVFVLGLKHHAERIQKFSSPNPY